VLELRKTGMGKDRSWTCSRGQCLLPISWSGVALAGKDLIAVDRWMLGGLLLGGSRCRAANLRQFTQHESSQNLHLRPGQYHSHQRTYSYQCTHLHPSFRLATPSPLWRIIPNSDRLLRWNSTSAEPVRSHHQRLPVVAKRINNIRDNNRWQGVTRLWKTTVCASGWYDRGCSVGHAAVEVGIGADHGVSIETKTSYLNSRRGRGTGHQTG
jgi:hypothetical protein